MGLDDPEKKMSKSETGAGHAIALLDPPNVIRKKIMRATTDSNPAVDFDTMGAGVRNLLSIFQAFSEWSDEQIRQHFQGMRYGDMKKGFAAACRRARITGLRWHDLRHTFASWFVQAGGDLYHLSRILGHSSVQMTTRYGHLRTQDLHLALERAAQNRPQDRLMDGAD